jgi:hypothetical protein
MNPLAVERIVVKYDLVVAPSEQSLELDGAVPRVSNSDSSNKFGGLAGLN